MTGKTLSQYPLGKDHGFRLLLGESYERIEQHDVSLAYLSHQVRSADLKDKYMTDI